MTDMCWYGTAGYPTEAQRDDVFAAFAAQAGGMLAELVADTSSQFPGVPAGLTSGVEVDGLPGFWWLYRVSDTFLQSEEYVTLADLPVESQETGGQHTGPWVE
ncbi:hypothetical protein ABGB07_02310 [Micromonosporaceae bacterium B7E4]